jgi:hypothetical protein
MRYVITLCVAVAAALAVAAPALASTTVRLDESYQQVFPAVYRATLTNVPAKTNGYAPRWLVAESIVGVIQARMMDGDGIPSRISIGGARWSGGTWKVRYRVVTTKHDSSYGKFTVTQGAKRVTFNGYS